MKPRTARLFLLLFLAALPASAQVWTNSLTGAVLPRSEVLRPNYANVPDSWYETEGWAPFTAGQEAARLEAESAAAAAAALEAEAARQLAKPLALKRAENNFFLLSAALFQGSMEKRGFGDLGAAVEALTAADPQTGIVLAVKLLSVDAEAKREGGLQWWDDAQFHPEIAE